MTYNSPLGKWSFFESEDSEFEHGFSNTSHRAIIAALQQSSFYYYHESDKKEHKELLSGSTYPAYYWVKNDDGERPLALAIYLNNQKSGFVDLNFDINLIKLNGQSVTYYIPFANQTGPSGCLQYAIKIHSKNVYDFLVFVQVTFLDVYSALFEKLRKHILDEIDLNINEPSVIIDWYNLLPIEMLATFSKEKRLSHLQAILNKSNLFNKAELAILKLLKSFNPTNATLPVENSKEALEQTYATYILKKLVDTKSKKVTFLERLYDAVNGDNFNELLQTLTSLWRNSSFIFSDHTDYNVFTQQVNIPYSASKSWGFNITNFSFVFKGGHIEATQTIILLVKEEPDDSVSEEELEELGENEPTYKRVAVEKPFGKFHVYQPLTFLLIKDDEIAPPEYFMPAFFLKATDDQKMWQNQLRLAYLTFNLASVFIGAGVILRFGQVLALVRAAQTAEAVLITVGSIQVVAGTADFFLTLTEDEAFQKQNPALYQSIRNWLLVVELASFGVEVISAKMLTKASEDVLANATDAIRKDSRWTKAEADLQRTARGETAAADATAKLVELTEKELKQLITSAAIRNRIAMHLKDLKFYKQADEYVVMYEGEKLFAHKGEYVRQFIDDLMTRPQTAKEIKKLKQLAQERRIAYADFAAQVPRSNIQSLFKHIFKGDFKITTIRRRGRIENASGMHYADEIQAGNVEVIDNIRIPPHPRYNEPFEAYIRINNGQGAFIDKLSPSGKMQHSTFFPEGWNTERIKEEIAFAWKNKSLEKNSAERFTGNSTTGLEIRFIIVRDEILTVYPIRKTK